MSDNTFKYQKYMIKSAPYGELPSVIQNLKKISPLDLTTAQAQQTLQQFNQEHLSLVKVAHRQSQYPIFLKSRDSQGKYIDQLHSKSYQINHLTHQIQQQNEISIDLPESVHQLLISLSKKLHTYIDKYYREPFGSQVFMEITEDQSLNVHLAFTSKNVQLNNFTTGEWNSVWLVNKNKIEGKVAIRAHNFEVGNIQMNLNKDFSKEFAFTADMDQNANKIIKIIEQCQCQVQKTLHQTYEDMSNGFFKHLRRIAPVTKTKMIWNVNAYKMNKTLQQTKK